MTIDNNLWVFGYGSLCWNPGFDYGDQVIGHIRGFARKFWQGNTTHRGTDEKVRDSWQLSSLSSKASQEMIERFCFIVSGQPSLLQVSKVYSHSFVGFVSLSKHPLVIYWRIEVEQAHYWKPYTRAGPLNPSPGSFHSTEGFWLEVLSVGGLSRLVADFHKAETNMTFLFNESKLS